MNTYEYMMKQLEELIDMTKKGSNISAISTAVFQGFPCLTAKSE